MRSLLSGMAPALLPMPCRHSIGPWDLQPPGAVARGPRHEGGAYKIRAGSRAYTVEAGDEIEGFGAAVREFRDDALAFVAHFLHHGAQPHLDTSALRRGKQDVV